MIKILSAFALTLVTAAPAVAQSANGLAGVWRQDDGRATVRIASCGSGADQCATVIDEKLELGEPSRRGKVVVRDIRPTGSGRWQGQFVDQEASMTAKIRQLSPGSMTFKICALAFSCETKRFSRLPR